MHLRRTKSGTLLLLARLTPPHVSLGPPPGHGIMREGGGHQSKACLVTVSTGVSSANTSSAAVPSPSPGAAAPSSEGTTSPNRSYCRSLEGGGGSGESIGTNNVSPRYNSVFARQSVNLNSWCLISVGFSGHWVPFTPPPQK